MSSPALITTTSASAHLTESAVPFEGATSLAGPSSPVPSTPTPASRPHASNNAPTDVFPVSHPRSASVEPNEDDYPSAQEVAVRAGIRAWTGWCLDHGVEPVAAAVERGYEVVLVVEAAAFLGRPVAGPSVAAPDEDFAVSAAADDDTPAAAATESIASAPAPAPAPTAATATKPAVTANASGLWTDRERLAWLVAAVDASSIKIDYRSVPVPAGRSARACKTMLMRLRASLAADLAAMIPAASAASTCKRKTNEVEGNNELVEAPTSVPKRRKVSSVPAPAAPPDPAPTPAPVPPVIPAPRKKENKASVAVATKTVVPTAGKTSKVEAKEILVVPTLSKRKASEVEPDTIPPTAPTPKRREANEAPTDISFATPTFLMRRAGGKVEPDFASVASTPLKRQMVVLRLSLPPTDTTPTPKKAKIKESFSASAPAVELVSELSPRKSTRGAAKAAAATATTTTIIVSEPTPVADPIPATKGKENIAVPSSAASVPAPNKPITKGKDKGKGKAAAPTNTSLVPALAPTPKPNAASKKVKAARKPTAPAAGNRSAPKPAAAPAPKPAPVPVPAITREGGRSGRGGVFKQTVSTAAKGRGKNGVSRKRG